MRKLLYVLLALILPLLGSSQIGNSPKVKWSYSVSKPEIKTGEEVELIIKAEIPENWYLYSNEFPGDGPIKAVFAFEENATYKLIGKVRAINPTSKMDEFFGEVKIFKKHGEFRQKIKALTSKPVVKGMIVEHQICTDVDGKCINFYEDAFDFTTLLKVSGATVKASPVDNPPDKTGIDTFKQDGVAQPIDTNTVPGDSAAPVIDSLNYKSSSILEGGNCEVKKFVGESGVVETKKEDENLWIFALVAFLSGLAALLTPCVFPMIPMTVTFFLKSSSSKAKGLTNALLYGLFIIVIYTVIGTIFSLIFGAQGANEFSTNAVVNIIFFLVFVIFAMSFFGMFEIVLPSKFVNAMDRKSDRGGLVGVFFMAFTLVLVSFSCTGPIVGSILVEASQGSVLRPVIGMLGFSLAFALPFTLFAIFPNWLQNLPKSGGWLNSVKVVLGFLELALGLKFLSVADQTYHWGILDREIYIALWIVIFFLMGVYLLGKLKFSHDSDLPYLGVPRLFMAIATFGFVVYLIPGMWGASLPGLAGYLPPTTSHDFNLPAMIKGEGVGNICEKPKHTEFLHLPHGLKGYFDYKQAINCAKELKKPLFIDFTGHGCVNCRKMEEKVWAHPDVLRRLEEDFVVVALYVDDRTELPQSEWVTSKVDGQVKKTIGRINADIQICYFGSNAQPNYVLLDNNEELLAEPIGTNYDVKEFIKFLDGAKALFNKRMGIKEKK